MTWRNMLQGQHITVAHPHDINFRVGAPLSLPSSIGQRSEHDTDCYSNWRSDPEICYNIILVARVTTSVICQPSKPRTHTEIDAVQGLTGLRPGLITAKIRRIVG